MSEFRQFGALLREVLIGLLQADPGSAARQQSAHHLAAALRMGPEGSASYEQLLDMRARLRRQDASLVPGSRHFASMLAYGNFKLGDGTNIRCEGIPGISGVSASSDLQLLKSGEPHVPLTRILTHFHFDDPQVLIEQHPSKPSTGTLTGLQKGPDAPILPGKASFSQYLILTLNGKPLANRAPLVMTAERVDQWPPVGSTFVSEAPTEFFELERVNDPTAKSLALLSACNTVTMTELNIPDR